MNKKYVNPVLLLLLILLLSGGCCLTGKKKERPAEPFRGPAPTYSTTTQETPPVVKEAVPVDVYPNPNGNAIPSGGVNPTSTNYPSGTGTCPDNSCPGTTPGSTCPNNTCPETASSPETTPSSNQQGVLTVMPGSGSAPSSMSSTTVTSGSPPSGSSSIQVDKPVTTPAEKTPSATTPSQDPVTPSTVPGPSPASVGGFDYANKEDPSLYSSAEGFRNVSDEQKPDKEKSDKKSGSVGSPGVKPAQKPKGQTVSLEKEVKPTTPSKTKKEDDASKGKIDLDASVDNNTEYSSEYPDGGDLTRSRPTGTYAEEPTGPKYARGYSNLSERNGIGQSIPFVSPGVYGQSRVDIHIRAVP